MRPVIIVNSLYKKYRYGISGIKENFYSAFIEPFLSNSTPSKPVLNAGEFWALKDINFEVGEGEIMGIVGPNGAGKSTLLKILSRITYPNHGSVSIKGKMNSLLEVGTGFHQELTGRENVYLNGAILGMKKKEIDRKFDEIVDFSGVEKFIDTPVKRYSSGMQTRLAFAVAANLEPEVLIVDEVLSVGDVEFQKKSTGKIKQVASKGSTVVFVSHNLSAISQLCSSCILLENGRIKVAGETSKVVESYLNSNVKDGKESSVYKSFFKNRRIPSGKTAVIKNVQVRFDTTQKSVFVELQISSQKDLKIKNIGIGINNSGTRITTVESQNEGSSFRLDRGLNRIFCEIPIALNPGRYTLLILLESAVQQEDYIDDLNVFFEVPNYYIFERPAILSSSQGNILTKAKWKT